MSQLFVAFYRGTGTLQDRVIRWATRSDYSHCELVRAPRPPEPGQSALCLSSSGRDRGVREKIITFKPGRWEFVPIDWAPADTWESAREELGKPYDYFAMFGSHLFNFRQENPAKWFCSELCGHALDLEMANVYSPGDLHRLVRDMTEAAQRVERRSHGIRTGSRRRTWL